ncbi:MAG: hypothetical protein NZ851_02335 [Aquificaceae bacterium]|nr:hypothetical protein [Aquificaceae bacterium]
MFYVSKVSIPFFFLAVFDLIYSLAVKGLHPDIKVVWLTAVFGFIAHTIMSAMYQIVPNSQGRPLRIPWLSYLVFGFSLFSSVAFYLFQSLLGSILFLAASCIFLLHILISVSNWQPLTVKFIGVGVLYLPLSGLFLLLSELGYVHPALAVHALTLGFMLKVVMGVELAWIPMLYMEALNLKLGMRLFHISLFAVPLLLVSFYFLNYKLIALSSFLVLVLVGYFLYIIYLLMSGKRMPKEIPLIVRFLLLALIILPSGLLLGFLMASYGLSSYLLLIHLDLLVYGFAGITIMGGMAHLYPRILYGWKFAGKGRVAISDLVEEGCLRRIMPLLPMSLAWMIFADVIGGPLKYANSLPYTILWLLFLRSVLLKGLLFRQDDTTG